PISGLDMFNSLTINWQREVLMMFPQAQIAIQTFDVNASFQLRPFASPTPALALDKNDAGLYTRSGRETRQARKGRRVFRSNASGKLADTGPAHG
ncbi:hypothetical protein ALP73_03013, partial [Pseudomonas coronafaciens pv. garcae]